jgi:ribosomal protein S18 acetylase RimI-like enzyme
MNVRIVEDRFDSELLARRCFKIHVTHADREGAEPSLAEIMASAVAADVTFLFTEFDPRVFAEAARLGFSLVSTRNVYAGTPSLLSRTAVRARFRPASFVALAHALATRSRYWKDPRLPPDRAVALYERWFENSIYGDYADEVFVAAEGDRVLGAVSLKAAAGAMFIDLIAVDERAQGRGIGRALVAEAFRHAAAAGVAVVKVETEGENLEANRFYQRLGFLVDSHSVVFHRHSTP